MGQKVFSFRCFCLYGIFLFLFVCLIHGRGYAQNIRALPFKGKETKEMASLLYNEAQVKVADVLPGGLEVEKLLTFFSETSWKGGCQGLSFDIVQNPNRIAFDENWEFVVQRGGKYLSNNPNLRKILKKIRHWSDSHPGHHVITIHINLKQNSTFGDDRVFCEKIDQILAEELSSDRIYRPAFLLRDASNLLEGVKKYGWPSLEDLRGNFIVVLSGDDSKRLVSRRRMVYTYMEPYKRLAFVDVDQEVAERYIKEYKGIKNFYYQEGARVFLNIKYGLSDWEKFSKQASQEGFITRVWKVDSQREWNLVKEAGVNLIATNKVYKSRWASLFTPSTEEEKTKVGLREEERALDGTASPL